MEDGHDRQQDGWEAMDLRSGVAKVYGEAKRRSTMGIRVLAAWAIVVLLFGAANVAGMASAAPVPWDFAAGFGGLLLAAIAASRAPGPMAAAAAVIIADLMMTAHRIPETIDHGTVFDQLATIVRMIAAPMALFLVLNGYFGCLAIQAFKKGFSPGADWRTRLSPATMQLVVAGACLLALGVGVASWVGSVMWGFEQTNVVWITKSLGKKTVKITVAKPAEVKDQRGDKDGGLFAEFNVINGKDDKAHPKKLPESVWPILTTAGFDKYGQEEVEDAFDFAKDSDEQGCLLEGEGREDRCRDDRCRYWARVFVRACLPKSHKNEHFCEDVPEANLIEAGTKWAERMCVGRKLEICRELLYAVQGHCHQPAEPTAIPAAVPDGKPAAADTPAPAGEAAPTDSPAASDPKANKAQ